MIRIAFENACAENTEDVRSLSIRDNVQTKKNLVKNICNENGRDSKEKCRQIENRVEFSCFFFSFLAFLSPQSRHVVSFGLQVEKNTHC